MAQRIGYQDGGEVDDSYVAPPTGTVPPVGYAKGGAVNYKGIDCNKYPDWCEEEKQDDSVGASVANQATSLKQPRQKSAQQLVQPGGSSLAQPQQIESDSGYAVGYAKGGPIEPQEGDTVYSGTGAKWAPEAYEASLRKSYEQNNPDYAIGYAEGGEVDDTVPLPRSRPPTPLREDAGLFDIPRKGQRYGTGQVRPASDSQERATTSGALRGAAGSVNPDIFSAAVPDMPVSTNIQDRRRRNVPLPRPRPDGYVAGGSVNAPFSDKGIWDVYSLEHPWHPGWPAGSEQIPTRLAEGGSVERHPLGQVLDHVRRKFGLHNIGQEEPTGYQFGGEIEAPVIPEPAEIGGGLALPPVDTVDTVDTGPASNLDPDTGQQYGSGLSRQSDGNLGTGTAVDPASQYPDSGQEDPVEKKQQDKAPKAKKPKRPRMGRRRMVGRRQRTGYNAGGLVMGYADGGDVEDDTAAIERQREEEARVAAVRTAEETEIPATARATAGDVPPDVPTPVRSGREAFGDLIGIRGREGQKQVMEEGERGWREPVVERGAPFDPQRQGLYPADRQPTPQGPIQPAPEQPITAESPLGDILGAGARRAGSEFLARETAKAEQPAGYRSLGDVVSGAYGSLKDRLAAYARGEGGMDPEKVRQQYAEQGQINPNGTHNQDTENIFKGFMDRKDFDGAGSFLQSLRQPYDTARSVGIGALQHGDVDSAIRAFQGAHNLMPNGKDISLVRNRDGSIEAKLTSGESFVLSEKQFRAWAMGPGSDFEHVADNGIEKNLAIAASKGDPYRPYGKGITPEEAAKAGFYVPPGMLVDKIGGEPYRPRDVTGRGGAPTGAGGVPGPTAKDAGPYTDSGRVPLNSTLGRAEQQGRVGTQDLRGTIEVEAPQGRGGRWFQTPDGRTVPMEDILRGGVQSTPQSAPGLRQQASRDPNADYLRQTNANADRAQASADKINRQTDWEIATADPLANRYGLLSVTDEGGREVSGRTRSKTGESTTYRNRPPSYFETPLGKDVRELREGTYRRSDATEQGGVPTVARADIATGSNRLAAGQPDFRMTNGVIQPPVGDQTMVRQAPTGDQAMVRQAPETQQVAGGERAFAPGQRPPQGPQYAQGPADTMTDAAPERGTPPGENYRRVMPGDETQMPDTRQLAPYQYPRGEAPVRGAESRGGWTPEGGMRQPPSDTAAPPQYPPGVKLVQSSTPGVRVLVGPDGKAFHNVQQGESPPSPDEVHEMLSKNREYAMQNRIARGDPVAIAASRGTGIQQYGQELGPEQPATEQSKKQAEAIRLENESRNPRSFAEYKFRQEAFGLPVTKTPMDFVRAPGTAGYTPAVRASPVTTVVDVDPKTGRKTTRVIPGTPGTPGHPSDPGYDAAERARYAGEVGAAGGGRGGNSTESIQQRAQAAVERALTAQETQFMLNVRKIQETGQKLTPAQENGLKIFNDRVVRQMEREHGAGAPQGGQPTGAAQPTKVINGVTYVWDGIGWKPRQ